MTESLDARVWREHEEWLEQRARSIRAWHRWTDADWRAAQLAADTAWDQAPVDLYLYDAERALREQHYKRAHDRLAAEASHGAEWLLGVLERTAAQIQERLS